MTDGCCVQCGAERVPILRQRLPRQTAARRDLRGDRDHPPRQTGTPEQHLVALAHVVGRYGHRGVVCRGGNSADAIGTFRQLCVRVNSQWQGEWSHFARMEAVKG